MQIYFPPGSLGGSGDTQQKGVQCPGKVGRLSRLLYGSCCKHRLFRIQVVSNGDDREQQPDQAPQRYERRDAAALLSEGESLRATEKQQGYCNDEPGDIEREFHALLLLLTGDKAYPRATLKGNFSSAVRDTAATDSGSRLNRLLCYILVCTSARPSSCFLPL
jgi:hypothetical protein